MPQTGNTLATPEEMTCSIVVPQSDGVAHLTAKISGVYVGIAGDQHTSNGVPVWFGCGDPPTTIAPPDTVFDDGSVLSSAEIAVNNGSLTCAVKLAAGRVIWFGSNDLDSWHLSSLGSEELKQFGRVQVPAGTTTVSIPR
jgi:hypothetical protein